MSSTSFFTEELYLIERNSATITRVPIEGDSTGNLVPYRVSEAVIDSINEQTKSGILTLRAIDGLFDSRGPILTDEAAKSKYLIQGKLRQDWRPVGERDGNTFRFELTHADTDESKGGLHVNITLTALDIRTDEFHDSNQQRLQTPADSFKNRLDTFNSGREIPPGKTPADSGDMLNITLADADNELPDDDRLKQDWLPHEPISTKRLFGDIVRRMSSPTVIGATNEDWYYEILPKTGANSRPGDYMCMVRRFGEIDSGVFLDVDTAKIAITAKTTSKEINAYFDNARYKNVVIGKGRKGAHTYPMDFARASSDLTHANIAGKWNTFPDNYAFRVGDYVQYMNQYLKCTANHAKVGTQVPRSAGNPNWSFVLPRQKETSPWTTHSDWWTSNITQFSAAHHGGSSGDYAGFFHDMNIVRKGYDLDDPLNEFENVSVKDVKGILNSPPSGAKHSERWLVGTVPTAAFVNHSNKIAQYDTSVTPAVWRFSKSPTRVGSTTPIRGDIVNDRGTGRILGWNGTAWVSIWDLEQESMSSTTERKPSPFFPVRRIRNVRGRDKTPDRAIEFEFNWNVFPSDAGEVVGLITDIMRVISPFNIFLSRGFKFLGVDITSFLSNIEQGFISFLGTLFPSDTELQRQQRITDELGTGSLKNRASRRFGFSMVAPFGQGHADSGKGIKDSIMDFVNLNKSMGTENVGWNNGDASEDLGNVRGVEFWVRLRHENNIQITNRTPSDIESGDEYQEINGIANVPMIFWYWDNADRVVFVRYTIRAHSAWQRIMVPAGPDANVEQFDSRIDEFFTALGYTFPLNFYIKERELTGALFNWRFVRGFGTFNAESYSENFLYTAGQDAFLKIFSEHALQYAVKNPAVLTGGLIEVEKVITDHVKFAIDDLHFIKDSYVTFNSGTNWRGRLDDNPADAAIRLPVESNPRQKKINITDQFDYVNMKDIVRRQLSRYQYHPARQVIETRGDVRLRPGQRFMLKRRKGTAQMYVPLSVKHVIDGNGYNCVIDAIRKYQVIPP